MGLDDRDADVLGDPKDACDCSGCGSQRKERKPAKHQFLEIVAIPSDGVFIDLSGPRKPVSG